MPRAVKGAARHQAKRKYFKRAKGFVGGRHRLYRTVVESVLRAEVYAFRDRKVRKRDFRRLWITRISAACRQKGIKYSEFINGLVKANADINRQMLADLAVKDDAAFGELVELAKASV